MLNGEFKITFYYFVNKCKLFKFTTFYYTCINSTYFRDINYCSKVWNHSVSRKIYFYLCSYVK